VPKTERRRERKSKGEGEEKKAPGPGRACSRLPLGVDLRAMPALHVNTRGALTIYMVSQRETLAHRRPATRRAARAVCARWLASRAPTTHLEDGRPRLSLRFSPVSLVRTCIWLDMAGGANTGAADRAPARARRGRDGPLRGAYEVRFISISPLLVRSRFLFE
jgi:hypothetical protein